MSTELNTNISANFTPQSGGIRTNSSEDLPVNLIQYNPKVQDPSAELEKTEKPTNSGKESPPNSEAQGGTRGNDKSNSDDKDVMLAVEDLNNYVQNIGRQLKFNVDDDTGRLVVSVLDSETQELIRQIPSEEIMTIARNLQADDEDKVSLFNAQV